MARNRNDERVPWWRFAIVYTQLYASDARRVAVTLLRYTVRRAYRIVSDVRLYTMAAYATLFHPGGMPRNLQTFGIILGGMALSRSADRMF